MYVPAPWKVCEYEAPLATAADVNEVSVPVPPLAPSQLLGSQRPTKCSAPDEFVHATVSPSEIVSVEGEKQNVEPPQVAEIVTAGSPAAPAVVVGTSALTSTAKPIANPAVPLRMTPYTSAPLVKFKFDQAAVFDPTFAPTLDAALSWS